MHAGINYVVSSEYLQEYYEDMKHFPTRSYERKLIASASQLVPLISAMCGWPVYMEKIRTLVGLVVPHIEYCSPYCVINNSFIHLLIIYAQCQALLPSRCKL
jgi:hypothetical protein